jgi:recombination protein RecA
MKDEVLKKLKGARPLSEAQLDLGNVSTGSYALNRIISGDYQKGIPIGAITEFCGNSSTGKTVFITHILREAQKQGYYAIMVDSENAYNTQFAECLGVDPEKLIYCAPESLEDCFETMDSLVEEIREKDKKTPIIIAYDSIAVSPIRAEFKDKGFDSHQMIGAMRAKIQGACLRKINGRLKKLNIALVVINQIREKVGVMFGSPKTKAAGGRALEYYLGVALECFAPKSGSLKDDDGRQVGIKGEIKNTKNKYTIPFQECDFKLFYDEGLEEWYGLCRALETDKFITRNGPWYSCGDEKFQAKTLKDKVLGAEKGSPFYEIKERLGLA